MRLVDRVIENSIRRLTLIESAVTVDVDHDLKFYIAGWGSFKDCCRLRAGSLR